MGFSTPGGGTDAGMGHEAGHTDPAPHPSFGNQLLSVLEKRYPLMGGLADMAFGHQDQAPVPMTNIVAPQSSMPQMPEYPEMIGMNAQPKQGGGGLGTILKLLAG